MESKFHAPMRKLKRLDDALPGTVLEFATGLTESLPTRVFIADVDGPRIGTINLKDGSRKILELKKQEDFWSIDDSHPVQILNNKETVDTIAEALMRKASASRRSATT
jgi:hypothetical protein